MPTYDHYTRNAGRSGSTLIPDTTLQPHSIPDGGGADLTLHLDDTADAHDASAISVVPAGTIAGTNVQTALEEVATDAAAALAGHAADTTAIHGIADTSTIELDLGWLRLKDDFGAVPGGGSAAANTTAINAAFAALVGSPHQLYVDPGGFDHAGPLLYANIGKSRIIGAGRQLSWFRQMTAGAPIFRNTAYDVYDVAWEHFGAKWDHVGDAADPNATASVFDFVGNGTLATFYGWNIRHIHAEYGNRFVDLTGTGQVAPWGSFWEDIVLLRMHKRGFRFISPSGIGMPKITLKKILCINDPTVQTATEAFIEGSGAQLTIEELDLEGWIDMAIRGIGGEPIAVRGVHLENHRLKSDGWRIFSAGDNSFNIADVAISGEQNVAGQTVAGAIISAFDGSSVTAENFDHDLVQVAGITPAEFVDVQAATRGVKLGFIRQSTGSLPLNIPNSDAAKASRVTMHLNEYALQIRSGTTAQRPSAANAGPGGEFYDRTLGKPIWSDGTVWRDAAGTTV